MNSASSDHTSPQLWLFDFDNTLALLEPAVDWAAGRVELEAEVKSTGLADDLIAQIPRGCLLLYDALRARLLSGDRPVVGEKSARAIVTSASEIIEKYELAGVDQAMPIRGAVDLLRAIAARRLPAAIVTSNSSRTVARWLKRHRVEDAIRVIVGRDSLLSLKPAPDMVERALHACGFPASAAALAGDSDADLTAARAAHVSFFGIYGKREGMERLRAAGACEVFSSPAALAEHFGLIERPQSAGAARHRRDGQRAQH